MRIAVDTMHMAGMALVCQGFAIFLMGASLPSHNTLVVRSLTGLLQTASDPSCPCLQLRPV